MYERYVKLRNELNLKDSEVAKMSGVGQSTFSDWKSGRSVPKREKLERIATALGVSADYFTGGTLSVEKAFTANERELLRLFRALNADGRAAALRYIGVMTKMDEFVREGRKPESSAS